jgi:hypothetical protein
MGDDVAGLGLGASTMLGCPSLQGTVDFIRQLANDNLRHMLLHLKRSDIIFDYRYHFKDEIWANLRSPDGFPADAQELRYLGQKAQLLVPHPPHLGLLRGG